MNQHLQTILNLIQQAEHLTEEEKTALSKAAKNADKELEITSFKLERTEKVKRTTAILLEETIEELENKRKAVEVQNRELEVEAALERVRAVAMSMSKPDDMLQVCHIISDQLELLNVKEIRNVQTAIFYESKGTYMNYEYYAKHNKTIITETSFTNHKMHREFAAQMIKGKGEFFTTYISKTELPDWIAYQKTTNVFIDDYLYSAASLNYYWFSLGPVALGISTYEPLKEEETNLFRRFLKVFELSFTRYLDIEQAIAQAREAQIQLALERVRARTMAMQKSDELSETALQMFEQVQSFGVELWSCGFNIWKEGETECTSFIARGGKMLEPVKLSFGENPFVRLFYESKQKEEAFWFREISKEDSKSIFGYVAKQRQVQSGNVSFLSGVTLPPRQTVHLVNFSHGNLMFITLEAHPEMHDIFKRLGSVFEQTYTRFLDLQKAEAQAREAQIEAALEKVRSRSLAMHKSDELEGVVSAVFEKLRELNVVFDGGVGILIFTEGSRDSIIWVASPDHFSTASCQNLPYDEANFMNNPILSDMWIAREKGINFYIKGYSFEEKNIYFKYLFNHNDYKHMPPDVRDWLLATESYTHSVALAKNSAIVVNSWIGQLLSENDNEILKRFARVFEQAYIRFLDLQKAEAQAREAQIESALERVRSRTMGMQKSDELMEAANLLFQQVQSLGIPVWTCGYNIWETGEKFCTGWMSTNGAIQPSFRIPLTESPSFMHMNESRLKAEPFYVEEVSGEALKDHYRYMFSLPDFKKIGDEHLKDGFVLPASQINNVFNFKDGNLIFISAEPVPEAWDIFKRFAKVFEQTYTRFLDLQKAEAQARESQIQLALERVRARTMAMQKSNELSETAYILFQQFKNLGEDPIQITIGIFNEDKKTIQFSITGFDGSGSKIEQAYNMDIDESILLHKIYTAWKEQKKSVVIELAGTELNDWVAYRNKIAGLTELVKFSAEDRRFVGVGFFSKGMISFSKPNRIPEEIIEILERFAKVFEQTYTRFLDLQKAEAQARESQIQLAMERVRARTMAMQHSDELKDAAALLFQQAKALGVPAYSCEYNIWEKDEKEFTSWMSTQDGSIINGVPNIPLTEDANFIRYVESKQNGEPFFVLELRGERMQEHYAYLKTIPAFKGYFDYAVSVGFDLPETQIHYVANFSQGNLLFITLEPCSEFHDVFKRFAAVFEQTYTRFLDLQKAEAQARESQIQLALERVRARTMAMQHSDELSETASLLFEQVQSFGVALWSCGFNISEKGEKECISIITRGGKMLPPVKLSLMENSSMKLIYEFREKGVDFWHQEMTGEEIKELFSYIARQRNKNNPGDNQFLTGVTLPAFQIAHFVNFSHGNLMFITLEAHPEMHDIFKRLGNVFEQTYTRFLDLQKAETQAREAQIELGLERVRARAMAMQTSEELNALIGIVFTELTKLDLVLTRCVIIIYDAETKGAQWWMANSEAPSAPMNFFVKYANLSFFNVYLKGWEERDLKWQYLLEGENKIVTDNFLFNETELKTLPDFVIEGMKAPHKVYLNASFNNFGNLTLATLESLSEKHFDILLRFAKVFDLTYTRFNDLQRAEAQAREAQIETALEKVRSRTMGMQKSEELKEVIQVVYEQFVHLNINVEHSGFVMDYKDRDDYDIWVADPLGVPSQVIIPYFDSVYYNRFNEAKEKGEDFFAANLSFEEKNRFYQKLFEYVPGLTEEAKEFYFSCPGLAASTVLLENIGLYIENFSGIPYTDEENKTLMRFGKVFQQTYTRFLDLQKAEAQAREAIKRSSVDRVRAEIASMRTTNDLERITPLIWNELTTLGVPFIRCGVFIMDDEQQQVNTLLSTPDGKAIAAFHLPYNTPGEIAQIIASWRKKEMYKQHWNEAQFIEFTQNLLQQGAVTTGEKYLTENHPTDLYLHFLPFLQGMLYVGNTTPLSDDELELVQNLADAFSTAYARYEDFNKLEAAKQQVDKTLVDLKQAQQQLVQSEKMASLGELTAGIAHEIQNPLNFVNNFSEVNKEMIVEMKEEIDKGNYDEVKLIANDIEENEEKINHHGKRAEAIVKGMLQHSRKSTGQKEPTDINALCDEYLRLSYHGLRAKDKSFNADFKTDFDKSIGKINIVPQDIGRVLLNLFNNAFYAVRSPQPLKESEYRPLVTVTTRKIKTSLINSNNSSPSGAGGLEITVTDNGNGIPQNIVDKIFQPFFTTKPTGEGTGLGLSLSYDIIKAHGGEIKVETKEGEGSVFIIQLPV